ncbi:MAG: chemotaxis protein CheW [Bacillota bacterium]
MSDFFGDDFTAELKGYFLDATLKDIEKYLDLVDASTLSRVRAEIREQAASWAVDAKTNEFFPLSQWIDDFVRKIEVLDTAESLYKALALLKNYFEALQIDKKDSSELASQFTLVAQSSKESFYLHCKVGAQEFVVPIENVIEVSGSLPIYVLPDHRPGISGVVPFRGEALPVFNLYEFGFEKTSAKQFLYVICDLHGSRFSLQVTETDELLSLKDRDLQNLDGASTMMTVPVVRNFFIKDKRSIMVLDLEKLVAA